MLTLVFASCSNSLPISREHIASIQQAGRRARDLTQQLLRFSRRDSVEPEVLNLNCLVDDMGWLLHCLVDDDIEVQTRLDADPATVHVDVSQMEQVIMNLVTNARDAMPHPGVLTVETSSVLPGERDDGNDTGPGASHVTLAIRDSGTGMDAEVKARLFVPFFTTKVRGKGRGLVCLPS